MMRQISDKQMEIPLEILNLVAQAASSQADGFSKLHALNHLRTFRNYLDTILETEGASLFEAHWDWHARFMKEALGVPDDEITKLRRVAEDYAIHFYKHGVESTDKKQPLIVTSHSNNSKHYPSEWVEQRKKVFSGLKERRINYTSRNPSAEAKAINQMLAEGLKPDDILKAYDLIKAQPFWADKNLSLMKVRTDIHEVLKNGRTRTNSTPRQLPKQYTRPEDL